MLVATWDKSLLGKPAPGWSVYWNNSVWMSRSRSVGLDTETVIFHTSPARFVRRQSTPNRSHEILTAKKRGHHPSM